MTVKELRELLNEYPDHFDVRVDTTWVKWNDDEYYEIDSLYNDVINQEISIDLKMK